MRFRVGDWVRVKDGIEDPDFGNDMSGWQGQISEIADDTVCIEWDGETLLQCPEEVIVKSEQEGLDWTRMNLEVSEVIPATPRNEAQEKNSIIEAIANRHRWGYLGESAEIIRNVLQNVDADDENKAFDAWEQYCRKHLSYPFEAEVEPLSKGPFNAGDRIRVHAVEGAYDLYGVIVKVRLGRKVFHLPLVEVRVMDNQSDNFKIIDSYRDWFANR
ncbi:MAG TPA: calcium-binding protein [Desulfosalsimonadaceae bacterium]|nr:calcium-binding protein [Desulfosalsimonadaceae bacterium]